MAQAKKATTKSSAAVHRGVDALADLLRETRQKRGRQELILRDQVARLADDEIIVLVVGKHNAVARTVRRTGEVDLRDLQLGVEGAALAVEELGAKKPTGATDLSAHEERLLAEGAFEPPRRDGRFAADEGALAFMTLLRESLSPDEAAALLHVNTSRVRQRLGERRLFGIKEGRSWRLPRFQFAANRLVPGIDVVLAALPGTMHPVAVQRWFRTPHHDLEVEGCEALAPLDWLKQGFEPARVTELASLLG